MRTVTSAHCDKHLINQIGVNAMSNKTFCYSVYTSVSGSRAKCIIDRTSDFKTAFNAYSQLANDGQCNAMFYDCNAITDKNPTGLRFKYKAGIN